MWSLQRGKKYGARRGVVQWYAVDVYPFVNVVSHGGGGGAQPDLGLFFGRLLKKPDPKTMMCSTAFGVGELVFFDGMQKSRGKWAVIHSNKYLL